MSSFDVPPIIRFLDLTFGGQYIWGHLLYSISLPKYSIRTVRS